MIKPFIFAAAAIYLGLFSFNAVTRTGHFTRDSMNYVNVARNILEGKGLTQPTLGFNQSNFAVEATIPSPFTVQAPLYPILTAFVIRVGISPLIAALGLSAIGYALVFLFVYKLGAELHDHDVGVAAIVVLPFYQVLYSMGQTALSDTIGIAFACFSLLLLAKCGRHRSARLLFFAGIAAGTAFATRYALFPLLGLGALFLLLYQEGWKHKFVATACFALGFFVPAGAVWGHNFFAGDPVMPSPGPRGFDISKLDTEFWMVFENYFGTSHPQWQVAFWAVSAVAFCGFLFTRRALSRELREIFFLNGRFLLLLWAGVYGVFLFLARSSPESMIEERYVIPIGLVLTILWVALAIRAIKIPSRWLYSVAFVLLSIAVVRESVLAVRTPATDFQERLRRSPRLDWIAKYTSDQDLIIGNDNVDIPFFLNRPATVSFSIKPYTVFATYEKVIAYVQRHCGEYRNIYLVLHTKPASEEQWRYWYGDFFADLAYGHMERYPEIVELGEVDDGLMFQIICL